MDTSLHIAICDSDPGDRKQMERLLSRESDARTSTTGNFYIDTFGNAGALINTPLVYDTYFLDVTDNVCNSYDIAVALREKGILSPIVYCISTIDYHNSGELLENSVFINKPIKKNELTLILDNIIEQKQINYIPTIELRNSYDTYYVEEKNVMYFYGKGCNIETHMSDNTIKPANTFITSLWRDIYTYPSFIILDKATILNVRHIDKVGLLNVTMKDGRRFHCSLRRLFAIKRRIEYMHKNINTPTTERAV